MLLLVLLTNLLAGVARHLALLHLIPQGKQASGRTAYLHLKNLPLVKDFEGLNNDDVELNPYYL